MIKVRAPYIRNKEGLVGVVQMVDPHHALGQHLFADGNAVYSGSEFLWGQDVLQNVIAEVERV